MKTIYIVHRGTLNTNSQADIFTKMNAAYSDKSEANTDADASDCNVTSIDAYPSNGAVYMDRFCTQEIPIC